MKELKSLKEMLCDELKEYGTKKLSAGSLETIDTLTHALKNLDKIIDHEEGYSGDDWGTMYNRGNSYARGRRRDSMGRYSRDGYSRHDDMIGELRYLMNKAEDDHTKMEFQRFIDKLEQM